jgi:SHS2 domain-containing protein
VSGTDEIRIEAWAASRELCVAEAVSAVVESFADLGDLTDFTGGGAEAPVELLLDPGSDEDLLIDVLEEVIYLVEVAGQVPLATQVEAAGAGLRVRFDVTDAGLAEPLGNVPKVVSFHDLRFGAARTGWACAVTLDR